MCYLGGSVIAGNESIVDPLYGPCVPVLASSQKSVYSSVFLHFKLVVSDIFHMHPYIHLIL